MGVNSGPFDPQTGLVGADQILSGIGLISNAGISGP
jgi:hypothetical protein